MEAAAAEAEVEEESPLDLLRLLRQLKQRLQRKLATKQFQSGLLNWVGPLMFPRTQSSKDGMTVSVSFVERTIGQVSAQKRLRHQKLLVQALVLKRENPSLVTLDTVYEEVFCILMGPLGFCAWSWPK